MLLSTETERREKAESELSTARESAEKLAGALEKYRGQIANDGSSGYAEDALAAHRKGEK